MQETHSMQDSYDAVVIGGGPAGSTAAAQLAASGHSVLVVEKAEHPRFHIGESLLPANLPIFEQLGVQEEIRALGMPKWGAEFVSPLDDRRQTFQFAESWDKSQSFAYQVRRSEFDQVLFRNAARRGAHVVENCKVIDVQLPRGSSEAIVRAHHEDGREAKWKAKFVVDASGRDTFLGAKLGHKRRNAKHNSAAIYAHFTGATRHCGKDEGNITIFWFDHGWFWFIPLREGVTSVGAVVWPYYLKKRQGSLAEFFAETIALCAPLAARLASSQRCTEVEATGNYSYACRRSYGNRYVLIGDAYTFIDPVFSTGVMLAMNSGLEAARSIDTILRDPARQRRELRRFDRLMRHGPKQFSWFIYRVTNPTMRELFLAPRNDLRMKEALLSLLAGDIFRNTPIWNSLRAFKGVYYLMSFFNLRRTWRALRQRAANIRPLENRQPIASG